MGHKLKKPFAGMRSAVLRAATAAALACGMLPLGACATHARDSRLHIVASLFPQYDFARRIAGGKAEVTLLLPPGTESHSFDPRPADIARIYDADLFLYTGAQMEPWAQRVVDGAQNDGLLALDLSDGIAFVTDNAHDDHDDGDDHDDALDPHIWLDPTLAMEMVERIAGAMCEKDPANAAAYRDNARLYKAELDALDKDFENMVAGAKRHTLVFGGRFAYAYFLRRYGLESESVFDSCSTHAEPSVQTVARVIDYIREQGIPCIYHEELVDPVVASSIAEQTGASVELFSTAHNVTQAELDEEVSYIDIMRGNLRRIQKGLY